MANTDDHSAHFTKCAFQCGQFSQSKGICSCLNLAVDQARKEIKKEVPKPPKTLNLFP
jgi:hypothetical protein